MSVLARRAGVLASVLQACLESPSLCVARAVHAQLLNSGLAATDTFLANRLVELYAKCGRYANAIAVFRLIPSANLYSWNAALSVACKSNDVTGALQLFDEMPERNVVSWNTVITALANSGAANDALRLYNQMIARGFLPTSFTFASVLSACGCLAALEEGWKCHALAVKIGLNEQLFVENALLGMYVNCESFDDAVQLFDGLSRPNEVSFTTMMGGMAKSGSTDTALRLFSEMRRCGIRIDHVAMSSAFSACAQNKSNCGDAMRIGESLHALSCKTGFYAHIHVSNSILDMFVKCGKMDEALRLFHSVKDVTVVTWNILLTGYSLRGDLINAKEMLYQMQQAGFEPDEVTHIAMLTACSKAGDVPSCRMIFDNIASPGVSSWNALLSGCCQGKQYSEAISFFRRMQFCSVCPDRTTMTLALSFCSGTDMLELGQQVHSASVRLTLHVDIFVGSGLVDMYAKCGRIEQARRVFNMMPERDVVCWNSMLTGLALHSQNHEAFAFYQHMRDHGILPTESSYASVINSCAKLSSVLHGRQVHSQAVKDGLSDNVFVGSALIDLYAKCGIVEEARLLFDYFPTCNLVTWNGMINGYAKNGLGKEAIELFEDMISERQQPDSITFIAVLTACSHSGLVDHAISYFNEMETVYGIKPQADHYTCIIDALGRAGRLGEVDEIIENMPCKDDPVLWEVLLSACLVHQNAKLGKFAAEHLFRLNPTDPSPYVLLSNLYAALGRQEDKLAVQKLMSERGIEKCRAYSHLEERADVLCMDTPAASPKSYKNVGFMLSNSNASYDLAVAS